MTDEDRERMGDAAVRVARACGYVNAGTVEFLYQDGEVYFLEMNTRLQVEHPVTELVTGLDMVAEQIRVAAGEPLSFTQDSVVRRGQAMECRINAEDAAGGVPARRRGRSPASPSRRLRRAGRRRVGVGDTVSQHYDNLLAKIVMGRDRDDARRRMVRALHETEIDGVATTWPPTWPCSSTPTSSPGRTPLDGSRNAWTPTISAGPGTPPPGPAPRVGRQPGWSRPRRRGRRPAVPGQGLQPETGRAGPRPAGGGGAAQARARRRAGASAAAGAGRIVAPMQGTIVNVQVEVGDRVVVGQPVCVLEAMKMENQVDTPVAGVVVEVRVPQGDTVAGGDVLVVVEADE